jgi:hypothetical protein
MKKTIIAAVLMCASMFPAIASATFVDCGGYDAAGVKQRDCGICDLFWLVNEAVIVVVKVLIPLAATLVVVYAGFKMIIKQGNSEVVQQCRSILLATAIGLVVVFASYAIVGVILMSMGSIQAGSALDWEPKCGD